MSVPLPLVDMSQYAIGQGDVVTLDKAKLQQPSSAAHSTDKAHIRVYNDSGSHLKVWMDTGDLNEYLPAGGWLTWAIDQTANEFHWIVVNVLPNPPVHLMMITYYRQGEEVPEIPTLGNSPIGGSVQSSGGAVSTLSNEGTAPRVLVIDIGDINFAQQLRIYNDGVYYHWLETDPTHHYPVFQIDPINASDLIVGITGRSVEVDSTLLMVGPLTIYNGISAAASSDLTLNAGTLNHILGAIAGVNLLNLGNGHIYLGAAAQGDVIDAVNPGATYIKGQSSINFQVPSGSTNYFQVTASGLNANTNLAMGANNITSTGTISANRMTFTTGGYSNQIVKSGTGNGTINFTITPFTIFCNPCTASGSSQTIGFSNIQNSVVTTGAGLAWNGTAIN